MKIEVIRNKFATSFTAGKMYVNDVYFCDTIEDHDRGLNKADGERACKVRKFAGQTAIPAGEYTIYMTFSPRFKKPMPLINNVPAFKGVRIHAGNTAQDTEGCILVGKYNKTGVVINSRDTFDKLYKQIEDAIKAGEGVTITIKRE